MYLIANGGLSSCNIPDTMDAILLTKNINYLDGVKLDIRMSKDGVLVLSCFDDLSKMTYSKQKISNENYDYIKKVKYPSHIFKYYIPTLDEILKRYNNEKIILLELYNTNNNDLYFQKIIKQIAKYPYKYYFLTEDEKLLKDLLNTNLNEYGEILNQDKYQKIDGFKDFPLMKKDVFIISKYPEKIHRYLTYNDNNFII